MKAENGTNGEEKKKGLVIMMGVAKKKPDIHIKKPEVQTDRWTLDTGPTDRLLMLDGQKNTQTNN